MLASPQLQTPVKGDNLPARSTGHQKQMINLDLPADVIWVPADQVPETGADMPSNQRHFDSLRQAVRFAMDELTIADRANVWISTDEGNFTIEQIEQIHKTLGD
jgi:hypothetical protein